MNDIVLGDPNPRLEDWVYDPKDNSIEGFVFGIYKPVDGMWVRLLDVDFDSINLKVTTPLSKYTLGRPLGEDAMSLPAYQQEFSSPFFSSN